MIFSRYARQNKVGRYICDKKEYCQFMHFFDENIKLEEQKRVYKYILVMMNKRVWRCK